ncbi:uncharacterized protein [Spinacia oleracea]|uniref:Uncharacterized protein n=1 Tax=Spinacia oleracea TaxID=3562 RepID=A0A9R0IDQ8_SPIOL|nr:uncharacterized protein LOC110786062 [Spinacia oleracea]
MKRVSINMVQVALVVVAMLFLLSTATATTVETSRDAEEMPAVMIVEEVVIIQQPKMNDNGNRKPNMMIMKPKTKTNDGHGHGHINQGLQCVAEGWYCNSIFGPYCCAGTCLDVPLAGGVCFGTW